MSKVDSEPQPTGVVPSEITSGLNIKIQKHHLSPKDINEFIEFVKDAKEKNPDVQISLVDYVAEKFYPGRADVVIVPDLSGEKIGTKVEYSEVDSMTKEDVDRLRENHVDLSGVDFTGSNMTGARFESCNMEGAVFCDSDLTRVVFNDCYMPGADLRGADISSCRFEDEEPDFDDMITGMKPVETSELQEYNNKSRYSGMQLSTLEPLLHQYTEKNEEIVRLAEERFNENKQEKLEIISEKLESKKSEVNTAYKKLGYVEYARGTNEDYNKLVAQQKDLEEQIKTINKTSFENDFDKSTLKYVVDPSVSSMPLIMEDSNILKFDPAYKRGSSKEERAEKKQYVRLTREDAENYLKARQDNPDLSINEFARMQMSAKNIDRVEGSRVIADFSTFIEEGEGALYVGKQTDLSGLDFSGANLQGACFAGTNLEGCKFNKANLGLATFEGANLENAEFIGTKARDTNLFAANIQGVTFKDADFTRAFMPHSDARESTVESSKFNFSDIRNGRWDGVSIDKSEFNYADLEGVSLANADIRRTKMLHANLEKAILNGCEIIESDLTGAFLKEAEIKKAKIKDTVLKDVDARGIDLTESEIDKLCKLEGTDLEDAIMRKVKADGVNFVGAHMDGVNLEHAQMKGAILEDVSMKFANLEGAVLEGVKANGVDLTGSNLTDINAKKGQFKEAILEGIEGQRANFTEAVMEGANLRGAKVKQAILEKVNLKKADLRDAELQKANLKDAEVEGVKINEGTDIHEAEITGVKGTAIHEGVDGEKKPMKLEEKKEIDKQVHAAEGKGFFSKLAGNVLKGIGGGCKKVADFIRQPISTKWGRILGAVAGALIVGAIAVTAVFTAGASLVVVAAVVAGAAAVGAGVGAVAGHYGAKHMGLSTVAAGIAGGVLIPGPVGVGVGLAVGVGANKVTKVVTGMVTGKEQSIDELAGNVVEGVGNGAKKLGEYVGVSEEQEKLVNAKKKCQEQYVAPEREPTIGKGQGKESFSKGRDEALRLEEMGIEVPTQSVSTKPRSKSLSEGLKGVKETLSRGEQVPETRQRASTTTKVPSSREL